MTIETIAPSTLPATPTRVGQQTHVEQARAVAEVAAMVQVAQQNPRNLELARSEMRRSCSEFKTADTAFFRYSRGGKTVTGPTVKLARELKRCFGNFESGWSELRRDDEYGQSEMGAWAWDVQTNARSKITFVVPHKNYYTGTDLTALRDIYEGNANQGSRREREMILGLLPSWFVEEAIAVCRETLKKGDGTPLVERQDRAAAALKSVGVDLARVERRVGRSKAQWSPLDLAELTVDYQSVKSGDISAEELFPPTELDVADLAPAGQQQAQPQQWTPPTAPAAAKRHEEGPALSTKGGTITPRQVANINSRFAEMPVRGTGQAYARVVVARTLAQQPEYGALTDLSESDGQLVLDNLAGDVGVRTVVRILTEDGAPAHLIPELPDATPAAAAGEGYVDGADRGPVVEPGGAPNDHDGPDLSDPEGGSEPAVPDDDDPAAGYDPTTDPSWGQHPVDEVPDETVGGQQA